MCEECGKFRIETGEHKLPKYEFIPKGKTLKGFFRELLVKGFNKKIKDTDKDEEKYLKQLGAL